MIELRNNLETIRRAIQYNRSMHVVRAWCSRDKTGLMGAYRAFYTCTQSTDPLLCLFWLQVIRELLTSSLSSCSHVQNLCKSIFVGRDVAIHIGRHLVGCRLVHHLHYMRLA